MTLQLKKVVNNPYCVMHYSKYFTQISLLKNPPKDACSVMIPMWKAELDVPGIPFFWSPCCCVNPSSLSTGGAYGLLQTN